MLARGDEDRRHAARVALGLLGPGLLLLAAGHPQLILFAVLGSFTGMYGRLESPGQRLRQQFHGAGMLVTGVALGTTLSASEAPVGVLVCCVTAFATLGSMVTDQLRLQPGGPFFGIFALGASATVSPGLVSPWVAVGICLATAVFSMAVGVASGLARSGRADVRPPAWRGLQPPERLLPGAPTHALRYALATGAAGLAGLTLGLDHANWAMAAAAVPLAVVTTGEPLDLRAVVRRGAERVSGTLVGLVVAALVLLPRPSAAVLAAAVMLLLFPTELFMSRHYGVALGFFTPLIMIMTELADPADPLTMLVARGVDTVIGVAAGIAAAGLIAGPRHPEHRREQAWAG